ncbi:proteinase B [Blastocladiella emersonii ATCC 22665]|nr:proteinase B [Blastocladiella emersonii ATCC 22665]
MLRTALGSALLAVLVATLASASPLDPAAESPLLSAQTAKPIPGHYMVVLRDDADAAHVADHHNWLSSFLATPGSLRASSKANRIKHVYDLPGVKGYAGVFDDEAVAAIRRAKHVAYVEQDQIVTIAADYHTAKRKYVTQRDAPWGLSRISHRTRPSAAHYKEYPHAALAGAGVSVYVIDTGINIAHRDFEGRARWGATIPENDEDEDGNGHGTHCAGTIAGKRFGVAKHASPVAVKVLASNGAGSMSDVVKGVEWAVQDHKRRTKKDKNAKSVASMSLGGGKSATLDRVVNAAVDAGIPFSVAAGNESQNACNVSPAATEKAVTVGASTIDDKMASFSNHGKCVDVFAPGKDILSTWIGSDVATNIISGTSMAAPHVAGLLATLASESAEPVAPKELKDRLIALSTKDVLSGLPKPGQGGGGIAKPPGWPFPWPFPGGANPNEGTTPNRLVFSGVKSKADDKEGEQGEEEEDTLRIYPIAADDEDEIAAPHASIVWIRHTMHRVRGRITGFF